MEHVSFWTADGVDDRPDLDQAIADSGIVVGAAAGMLLPPPGQTPPLMVAARAPKFLANMRDVVVRGAVVVAGTDAGIAPVKPHDILRTAVTHLGVIGMLPRDAFEAANSLLAAWSAAATRRAASRPGP